MDEALHQRLKQLASSQGVVFLNCASATGRTLAAEMIAGNLNIEVLRMDGLKLQGLYTDEIEKNIDQLLSRAEEKQSILFFDEADALFGKRTQVKDSHDRFANQEASYLLQKLEGYTGLAILATNLRADEARQLAKRFTVISDDDQ